MCLLNTIASLLLHLFLLNIIIGLRAFLPLALICPPQSCTKLICSQLSTKPLMCAVVLPVSPSSLPMLNWSYCSYYLFDEIEKLTNSTIVPISNFFSDSTNKAIFPTTFEDEADLVLQISQINSFDEDIVHQFADTLKSHKYCIRPLTEFIPWTRKSLRSTHVLVHAGWQQKGCP